jgi:hypothetical protein
MNFVGRNFVGVSCDGSAAMMMMMMMVVVVVVVMVRGVTK